jgi:hypothetical protein
MIVEKQMECRLARETEVLGENLPQRHFCPSQNPTRPDPDLNPGRRGGKQATNRLSYGAAPALHTVAAVLNGSVSKLCETEKTMTRRLKHEQLNTGDRTNGFFLIYIVIFIHFNGRRQSLCHSKLNL